jgi:hypothetical protein
MSTPRGCLDRSRRSRSGAARRTQLLVLGDAGVTADEEGVDRAGLCAWLATAPPFGGSRQVLEQRDRCLPPNAGVRNAAAIGQWYAGNELLPTSQ